MDNVQDLVNIKVDMAVIKQQNAQIVKDIREIKEMRQEINELQHFRTRVKTMAWLASLGIVSAAGAAARKLMW